MTRLECGRCVVRSWRPDDADDLARVADDYQLWLNLRDRFPHPYTRDDAVSWIRHCIGESPETHFAITIDDRVVGAIGYDGRADVEVCSAEIGYWVAAGHRGRGVATAALRAVTEHAFRTLGLTRVFATVFTRNVASERVLEKAGYEREGVLRRSAIKAGVIEDQAVWAVVR